MLPRWGADRLRVKAFVYSRLHRFAPMRLEVPGAFDAVMHVIAMLVDNGWSACDFRWISFVLPA
eukprot:6794429-Lingulodinium_polyedra.AAC.1